MKRYRARWTHTERRAAFAESFDDFGEAVSYLAKVTSHDSYAINATVYDGQTEKCVCAFRNIR